MEAKRSQCVPGPVWLVPSLQAKVSGQILVESGTKAGEKLCFSPLEARSIICCKRLGNSLNDFCFRVPNLRFNKSSKRGSESLDFFAW